MLVSIGGSTVTNMDMRVPCFEIVYSTPNIALSSAGLEQCPMMLLQCTEKAFTHRKNPS
jgi:hypothetical protein